MFKYLLLFVCFTSFSQTNQSINGQLVDSLTREPLSFASIQIESKNQPTLLYGQIANEKGFFEFTNVKIGTYILKIQYVGFQTKLIDISMNQLNGPLKLGTIYLTPQNQELETIQVSKQKIKVMSTLEKQIFKADQFEVAKGGTAADVLKNIPSVMINAEGEISMRGSKGFLILIDGKPTQVDAATILAQIAANTIENIEMITAPTAKYDADGKAGIINIVTKKGTKDGWSLSSNMQYGLPRIKQYENATEPSRQSFDLSATFQKGKWNMASSFNYLQNDIAGRRIGDVRTIIQNVLTSFPSEGERSFKRDSYGFRSSALYAPTKNDDLLVGVYIGKKNQYRTADIFYTNSKYNVLTNTLIGRTNYFNANLVLRSGYFNVYNVDYTHRFRNKSSLSLSGLHEYAMIDGFTQNRNLRERNTTDTLQYTLNTGENPLNAYRLKIDYETSWGIGKLTMGYQYRNQLQNGVFNYFQKSGNGLPLVLNPNFSAQIQIVNKIHGLYAQYGGVHKKLEFTSGLRYENAFRDFQVTKSASSSVLKLANFFPSANILYNVKDDLRFKIAYSRRVQRSTNSELNPYPEREHSETLEQGDPSILPEFIRIMEAGFTKDFKKSSFYVTLYTQQIDNIVNRVNSVYNDTILNRIYTNAGKAQLIGSDMGFTYSPFKNLRMFVGGNIYSLQIKGALFNNSVAVNSNGLVYSINSNISYQINTSTSAQFNLAYLSAKNTAQGIDSRFYQPNISLKKGVLKNKLFLTVQWQNLAFGNMKVNEQSISTTGDNFYTSTNYVQETNIFLLNLSYNFQSSEKKLKLSTSEFGESEFK